ncbi:hypothetical protein CJ010_23955 [Azoarcus sp. DD4]|uniref:nickel-dependent hydrogenase large subunit n=1 Tax=Azoarcus sp. DD4 TaxID=2027405 RepID=UPI00112A7B27|nr:nickel-dependent hydrogenase large subunit [Azoarcus sp. DD4]QDF99373.1 hypothetical protein CJ010_23955 [Azoarcus sp. DD4]
MGAAADPALLLHATLDGGQVGRVVADNRRPQAAQLLVGRSPAEAVALVPRLFALCGCAQGTAARLACAAALGEPGAADAAATERELAAEAAHEHLWRLLLDWPPLFGLQPRRNRYAELHRRLVRPLDADSAYALGGDLLDLVARELLAGFFRALREPRNLAEFVDHAAAGGDLGSILAEMIGIGAAEAPAGGVCPLLPALTAAQWIEHLGGLPDAAFCRQPMLDDAPAETGPLARHAASPLVALLLGQGHRISARLFAKVLDVADCGSRLRRPLAAEVPALADAVSPAPGLGLACVETARGVLLHAVRIENDRIADYAICAPTEWNFHPGGAFVREGGGWRTASADTARLRLQALALALDPCVGFRVELEESTHA